MLSALLVLVLAAIVPVHGLLLALGAHDRDVVRIDGATSMLAAQTRTFGVETVARLEPGEEIDGFVDPSHRPWRLSMSNRPHASSPAYRVKMCAIS